MRILGITKAETCFGKRIRDGGAAIYDNGKLTVLSEAGITGRKHAGGYDVALEYLSAKMSLDAERDFDHIAVSTCCEPLEEAGIGHALAGHDRLSLVGHHLSHASIAFGASGFAHALVVVVDGGGNVLPRGQSSRGRWWEGPREQFSAFLGTAAGLELIGRDFAEPFDVGLAELYRAFTYFLGWHSYVYAAKTMALAGLGNGNAIPGEVFQFDGENLTSPIRNAPSDPVGMVQRLAGMLQIDLGEPRPPGAAISRRHCDTAAFIQRGIQEALERKLSHLARQTGMTRLCLAGGLALNVVANGRLHKIFPDGVYVPSAPGDDGQSLGNVYAMLQKLRTARMPAMTRSSDAYLGPAASVGSAGLATALLRAGLSGCVVFESPDIAQMAAAALAGGAVVCVFGARSEHGPRALGARSILADPRARHTASSLNSMKAREHFLPFAPVMLESRCSNYFPEYHLSPFMSFAFPAFPSAVEQIPAVIHADGTARVQTVSGEDGTIARILQAYERITGIPVLLNTSFNAGGSPIVETVEQALETFARMPVDVLVIGRFTVLKATSWVGLPQRVTKLPAVIEIKDVERSVSLSPDKDVPATLAEISELTGSVVFVRYEIPLYTPYLRWLQSGTKRTTIRFRRNGVEIPSATVLPLVNTPDFMARDKRLPAGQVRISGIRYVRFGALDYQDAAHDGFGSPDEMRRGLADIYKCLGSDDWVTIFEMEYIDI
jgi:carbamoyltransferase